MKTGNATQATERIFISSMGKGWGLQNVPLTFAQIEAQITVIYPNSQPPCPEARATAFAYEDESEDEETCRWVVFIDYDGGEEKTFVGGIFRGSEEDAEEVARLMRESKN